MVGKKLIKKGSLSHREEQTDGGSFSTRVRARVARLLSRPANASKKAEDPDLPETPHDPSVLTQNSLSSPGIFQNSSAVVTEPLHSGSGDVEDKCVHQGTFNDLPKQGNPTTVQSDSGETRTPYSTDVLGSDHPIPVQLPGINHEACTGQTYQFLGANQDLDDGESVRLFDEDGIDLSTMVIHDTSHTTIEGFARQSIVRSEVAILNFVDSPDQDTIGQGTIEYALPIPAIINQLRAHMSVSDFGELSLGPYGSRSSPSLLSNFALDTTAYIDSVMELYNSTSQVSSPVSAVGAMIPSESSREPQNTMDLTRFSTIERLSDPAIVLAGLHAQVTRVASRVGPSRRYPALIAPERLYAQAIGSTVSQNHHRINPENRVVELEETSVGAALQFPADELPPPIPERSPLRPKGRVNPLKISHSPRNEAPSH